MENRYLCSDLGTIHVKRRGGRSEQIVANIEAISASEATLQLERPVAEGTQLRLECSRCDSGCDRRATVEDCRFREGVGYDCKVVFEVNSAWSPDQCRPAHLLDLNRLASKSAVSSSVRSGCPNRRVCPREVIARLIAPNVPLAKRARAVGREVAVLCGELDEAAAGSCFSSLLHADPGCRLFDEFLKAYRAKRRSLGSSAAANGEPAKRVRKLACLLDGIPKEALGPASCSAANTD